MQLLKLVIITYVLIECVRCNTCFELEDGNEEKKLSRYKRYLIYYEGGLFKIVIGFAMPIMLGLKQSLAVAWNVQFQYPAVSSLAQVKKPYPPIVTRSIDQQTQFSERALTYLGIEAIIDRQGFSGKDCLLRGICENAMNTFAHDDNALLGKLLDIILTPEYSSNNETLDYRYIEARKAGKYGIDCYSLYNKCPEMINFLDMMTFTKFPN